MQIGRNLSVLKQNGLPVVVDVEQLGRQGVAPVVALTLLGIEMDLHHSPDSSDNSPARVGRARINDVSMLPRTFSNTVPILLLPPSEGKALGGNGVRWSEDSGSFDALAPRRRAVVDALAACGGGDPKLLGVGGDHLTRAQSANATLLGAATLPAWQRYTGVVWDHLDPASLDAAQRRRILVVSGLLGVVRGDDPVPDYRLKMGANLSPLGKLSTWWRDDVSASLNRYAAGRTAKRPRVIVDLLPKEHRAAWIPDTGLRGVSIEFVDPTGKPGGHFAKAAKGSLAAMILRNGLDVIDSWNDDRFELSVTLLS
jgi:uncharacterized protein